MFPLFPLNPESEADCVVNYEEYMKATGAAEEVPHY